MRRNANTNLAMFVTPVDDMITTVSIVKKVVRVVGEVCDEVYFVSGCLPESESWPENCIIVDLGLKLHYVKSKTPYLLSMISWIGKLAYLQLRMALEVITRRKSIDIVFCYLGYHYQIPIIIAKLLGKKVISSATGITSDEVKQNYGDLISKCITFIMDISYYFSDAIIIQSWRVAKHKSLSRWKNKMRMGASYFGANEIFKPSVPITQRKDVIGYVGRFTQRKGVFELVTAFSMVLQKIPNTKLVLIGRGLVDVERKIKNLITELGMNNYVECLGQIPNNELPEYYNEFKLLVIPSTSEGLPNVLLEAINCNTPILSTPVGAIPDIVRDRETGFLLENNEPGEIANRIVEILMNQNYLEQVVYKAREEVQKNYSFKAAVNRYHALIGELCGN